MADFFAVEADEVQAIDAFVDFLAVEHSPSKLVDADAEEIFVVLLYFATAGFVTRKVLVFRFVMSAVVNIVGGTVLGRPTGPFLFRPRHVSWSKLHAYLQPTRGSWRLFAPFHNERGDTCQ